LKIPQDYKQHYKDFLKIAGFKSGRQHHRSALLVNISQRDNQIVISPTKNGGFTGKDRGFLGIKNTDTTVAAEIDNITLGDKIRIGWTKSECNCR